MLRLRCADPGARAVLSRMQPGMAARMKTLQTAAEYAMIAACLLFAWHCGAEVWGQISAQYADALAQLSAIGR